MREALTFTNEYGSVRFGATPFFVQSIDGINKPEFKRQEVSTIDTDGKRIVQTVYTSKNITINGYIRAGSKEELRMLKMKLTRILDFKSEGKLTYDVDSKVYFTEGVVTDFVPGEEIQTVLPFVISFDAINVYWKACVPVSGFVYKRVAGVPNLALQDGAEYQKFQFPCVFSVRKNKKVFYNKGTMPCDFVCVIKGTSENATSALSADDSTGFQIINNTNGDNMIVNYDVSIGETVTVDTSNFSIESDVSGNLLHKLHLGSDFFKLAPGESEIEVINFNSANNILVEFTFHETYKEV